MSDQVKVKRSPGRPKLKTTIEREKREKKELERKIADKAQRIIEEEGFLPPPKSKKKRESDIMSMGFSDPGSDLEFEDDQLQSPLTRISSIPIQQRVSPNISENKQINELINSINEQNNINNKRNQTAIENELQRQATKNLKEQKKIEQEAQRQQQLDLYNAELLKKIEDGNVNLQSLNDIMKKPVTISNQLDKIPKTLVIPVQTNTLGIIRPFKPKPIPPPQLPIKHNIQKNNVLFTRRPYQATYQIY